MYEFLAWNSQMQAFFFDTKKIQLEFEDGSPQRWDV